MSPVPSATLPTSRTIADLIAYDREGRAILLVDIKIRPFAPGHAQELEQTLRRANTVIPFGMLVNSDQVRLYAWDGARLTERLDVPLRTEGMLGSYSRGVNPEGMGVDTLRILVDVWIQDLAFRWKQTRPPGCRPLAEVGLLDLLEGGSTQLEVPIGGPPVP